MACPNGSPPWKAAEDTVAAQRKAIDDPALSEAARQALRQQLAYPRCRPWARCKASPAPTTRPWPPSTPSARCWAARRAAPTGPSPAIAWAATRDAIDGIIEQARSRQIVILNEAHHVPAQRAFAMQLARELRKAGYTYLAVEALSEAPLAKGYFNRSSGYYVSE
ncbi:hypothetical protein LP419_17465 [Massilia sp. H-1]|nr:hypothetical protein LP419_17465 [Massilia sp. H-1]